MHPGTASPGTQPRLLARDSPPYPGPPRFQVLPEAVVTSPPASCRRVDGWRTDRGQHAGTACPPAQHPPAPPGDTRLPPRQDPVTFSLMKAQMIRVISSPSISTTGLATLIRLSASGRHRQGLGVRAWTPPLPAPQHCAPAQGHPRGTAGPIWLGPGDSPAQDWVLLRVPAPLGCTSGCKPHWGLGWFTAPTRPGAGRGCCSGLTTLSGRDPGASGAANVPRDWDWEQTGFANRAPDLGASWGASTSAGPRLRGNPSGAKPSGGQAAEPHTGLGPGANPRGEPGDKTLPGSGTGSKPFCGTNSAADRAAKPPVEPGPGQTLPSETGSAWQNPPWNRHRDQTLPGARLGCRAGSDSGVKTGTCCGETPRGTGSEAVRNRIRLAKPHVGPASPHPPHPPAVGPGPAPVAEPRGSPGPAALRGRRGVRTPPARRAAPALQAAQNPPVAGQGHPPNPPTHSAGAAPRRRRAGGRAAGGAAPGRRAGTGRPWRGATGRTQRGEGRFAPPRPGAVRPRPPTP